MSLKTTPSVRGRKPARICSRSMGAAASGFRSRYFMSISTAPSFHVSQSTQYGPRYLDGRSLQHTPVVRIDSLAAALGKDCVPLRGRDAEDVPPPGMHVPRVARLAPIVPAEVQRVRRPPAVSRRVQRLDELRAPLDLIHARGLGVLVPECLGLSRGRPARTTSGISLLGTLIVWTWSSNQVMQASAYGLLSSKGIRRLRGWRVWSSRGVGSPGFSCTPIDR